MIGYHGPPVDQVKVPSILVCQKEPYEAHKTKLLTCCGCLFMFCVYDLCLHSYLCFRLNLCLCFEFCPCGETGVASSVGVGRAHIHIWQKLSVRRRGA